MIHYFQTVNVCAHIHAGVAISVQMGAEKHAALIAFFSQFSQFLKIKNGEGRTGLNLELCFFLL